MPSVMAMQDVGDRTAIKKALYPAVDASMITRMKRQAAIVSDLVDPAHPNGRKGMGAVVDGQMIRGFDGSAIRTTYLNRGARFSFFRVV
jgi:hypothetical protein